ncbi:MAG: hypothetical protein QW348_01075 [Ignisphaera sp.]
MVVEIKNREEANEYISKHKLTLIALAYRKADKDYIIRLLKIIEEESQPTIYTVLVYDTSSNNESARQVELNLYVDGFCVFTQEGIFNDFENDITALKRGIKEALKARSIQVKFIKR